MSSRYRFYAAEPPFEGETPTEARARQARNRRGREAAERHNAEPCRRCGQTRSNVVHETDRAHAPEGLDYYVGVPFCAFLGAGAK